MAEFLKDSEFLLPPDFLTDDDILMGKENFYGTGNQLPYDFLDSESDEEGITGLIRQFSRSTLQIPQKISFPPSNQEAKWVYSSSPQSTLCEAGSWSSSSNGSPNGFFQNPSPPMSPFVQVKNTRNMIYAVAADEVARMKMNLSNRDRPTENRPLFAKPHSVTPSNYTHNCVSHSLSHHNHSLQICPGPALKQQGYPIWGKPERERWLPHSPQVNQSRGLRLGVENGRPMGSPQSEWPCLQVQNHRQQKQVPQQNNAAAMNRAVLLAGSGGCRPMKSECAGTGVFIPLNPSESRRKPACSTALLPAQVLRPKPPILFTGGPLPNLSPTYDLLIARRNAAMAQQQHRQNIRPEVMMKHHEVMLPQEWTY